MTPTEVRNIIMSRYLTEFAAQFPIIIDNQKGVKGDKWVRLNVQFSDGNQGTLGTAGNRKYLRRGIIFCQVFTLINKGTDDNDDTTEASVALFDGVRIQELWMFNGRIDTVGNDDEYYQQNAVIEFEFEMIR